MHKNNLSIDEWYDVCAIGYCKAIETFNGDTKLTTYAYRCMRNEVDDEIRKKNAIKRETEKLSISEYKKDQFGKDSSIFDLISTEKNFEKDVITRLVFFGKNSILNSREKQIAKKILEGYSVNDISEQMEVSKQYVHKVKKNIKNKLKNIFY